MRKSLQFSKLRTIFQVYRAGFAFYPLTVLGAQGHITVKGQSITIKEAIMLIEKNSNYVFLQCCGFEKHSIEKYQLFGYN